MATAKIAEFLPHPGPCALINNFTVKKMFIQLYPLLTVKFKLQIQVFAIICFRMKISPAYLLCIAIGMELSDACSMIAVEQACDDLVANLLPTQRPSTRKKYDKYSPRVESNNWTICCSKWKHYRSKGILT